MKRRAFLSLTAATGLSKLWSNPLGANAPAIIISDKIRPQIPFGAQCGDVAANRAVIWSRSDREARMIVEYSTTESFQNARRVIGPAAIEPTDFTARVDLGELPAGQKIFYRVAFQSLDDAKVCSEGVTGSFLTAPKTKRDVSFVWGGDVCGQGWGINPEFGGLKIYEAMRRMRPDLFIHSGDAIYADGVIPGEVKLDDGWVWKNLTAPEKSKVAETLDEFRGNYRYNLTDENLRRFNSEVPMLAQWDDHETRNNWYPGQRLDDDNHYTVKSIDLLSARAKRAFLDYMPIRFDAKDPERICRAFGYGPLLDIFMLDERSYRGPNTPNRQTAASDETAFLGAEQMAWVKQSLLASKARWKVIASDMPIGIIVKDGPANFEAFANGNGPAMGRELELAELLRFIKRNKIKNVVWLTADVHYCAAHYYDPAKAQFTDFDPFWEFVAGPLNAGAFPPGEMDDTFGPDVKFTGTQKGMKPNRSPKEGFQFFGAVKIDGKTEAMTVGLHDINGNRLFSVDLPPRK
ncbi:MAG TPA: alkaline phosphatase D family protein [Blastocatellia bacterium]|jgi:alkaline phosphatase D|nr:alkaline phosphatase D family protein [Blastocatellia bacterium]